MRRRSSLLNTCSPIRTTKLKNPDRVVIDLSNATWNRAPKRILVKRIDVDAVRIALYHADPPVTRLVVDLPEARDYELASSGNRVRVKLHTDCKQIATRKGTDAAQALA